jgi:inorganic phosphate transporter, PiT family
VIAVGFDAVQTVGVVSKVLIPAVLAPLVAVIVATLGTYLAYRISSRISERIRERGFRLGQIGTASLVSLAHGANDAQKTMGIITLALIANKTIGAKAGVPLWVVLSCATAISLGTYLGGWRIIRTRSGSRRDRAAAGLRRGRCERCSHLGPLPPGLPDVHDPRVRRIDRGLRPRQAVGRSPLDCRPADGRGVWAHPPRRRRGRALAWKGANLIGGQPG